MSYSDDYVSVDLAITFVILDTLDIFLIDWLIEYRRNELLLYPSIERTLTPF